jgi:cysteine desulfurase
MIYLDCNATTPVDPQVLEAMLPYLRGEFGNPSSAYALGRRAHAAVEQARGEVAELIGARPEEIVFTGGATEATNIAIRGAVAPEKGRTGIVSTNIEHPATDACCRLLERAGHAVTRVPAGPDGIVAVERVTAAADETTALVAVIHAQNEIGTIQPVGGIAHGAKARGALVHADAAQSVGKVPVSVGELGVDLLTIAGHKLYAPKGIGALYVRAGLGLPPLAVGAGQEQGRRPGTENVAFIVGLGAACRLAQRVLKASGKAMAGHAAALLALLQREVPGLELVGDPQRRLPNTLNVLFPGVPGRLVLEHCPEVMASTGSAWNPPPSSRRSASTATGRWARSACRWGVRRRRPRSSAPLPPWRGPGAGRARRARATRATQTGERGHERSRSRHQTDQPGAWRRLRLQARPIGAAAAARRSAGR